MPELAPGDTLPERIEVTLRTGEVWTVRHAHIDHDSLLGDRVVVKTSKNPSHRTWETDETQPYAVALGDIQGIHTRHTSAGKTVAFVAVILALVTAGALLTVSAGF